MNKLGIILISCIALLVGIFFIANTEDAEAVEGYESTLSFSTSNAAVYNKYAVDNYVAATTATTIGYAPVRSAFAFKMTGCTSKSQISPEVCEALTGSTTRCLPATDAERLAHSAEIEVPIWVLNENTGTKEAQKVTLTVNKVLTDDVLGIFTTIFNDPSQPVIQTQIFDTRNVSAGGFHTASAALDVNVMQNPFNGQGIGGTPVGDVKYLDPANRNNPYCLDYTGPIVMAFAKYGWGWGGRRWVEAAYGKRWDWDAFEYVDTGKAPIPYDLATYCSATVGYVDMMHFSATPWGG